MRLLAVPLLCACAATPQAGPRNPLSAVRSWAIQLQGLEKPGAAARLGAAGADLVVIDAANTVRGSEEHPTAALVAQLRRDGGLCLAYLNVGQAEDYRAYWRNHWKAPTKDGPGTPDYLLSLDPEGWPGNYPVAYWDFRWRGVLWGGAGAPLDRILADGFDGVYLDWVLGYADATVRAAAEAQGVDAKQAMVELVRDLRAYARKRKPGFLVIAQNCATLPDLMPHVDGLAQEDLSFRGRADATWDDEGAGDIATPPEAQARLLEHLRGWRAKGVPVFTLDYAAAPANAEKARALSRAEGFVPFVTRTPLDRLP